MAIDKVNLATVEKMWRREVEAATTYRHLAERERDPKRRDILMRLAEQEDNHAARWAERIAAATGRRPDPQGSRARPVVVPAHLGSERRPAPPRAGGEPRRSGVRPADGAAQRSRATGRSPRRRSSKKRDHAVILRTLAGGTMPSPRSTLDTILRRERWHVRGTGWIGDAIYGVNDGLGAVFGIVSGMAGYTGGSEVVLAAGLAGTLASALSMGAGAYLASKSEREVYESEVARERAEIEEDPHEELLELELFYQLKGFSAEEAHAMAERIQKEPKQFLRTLVHEELGLSEETFPNPMRSTISATRVDRDRRIHPDHSVLLHRRHAGGDRVVHHQHRGALRGRRVQGPGHDAAVVGNRARNDGRRHHRGGDHLRRRGSRSPRHGSTRWPTARCASGPRPLRAIKGTPVPPCRKCGFLVLPWHPLCPLSYARPDIQLDRRRDHGDNTSRIRRRAAALRAGRTRAAGRKRKDLQVFNDVASVNRYIASPFSTMSRRGEGRRGDARGQSDNAV